ncbi:MAG: hypothetical protein KDB01_20595, partial [Planctomycetaceae bacterium]|nr:hypothetical protein [Planctomycetaceae bacterium]
AGGNGNQGISGAGGNSGAGSGTGGPDGTVGLYARTYLVRTFLMFADAELFAAFPQLIVDPFNGISVVIN